MSAKLWSVVRREYVGHSSNDIGFARQPDGTFRAIAGPAMVVVRTPVELRGEDLTTVADFTVFQMLLMASHIPQRDASALRTEIMRRFSRDRDRSVFGLANAVTSLARDQEDPEVRWRLEELGGGVLARIPPRTKPHGSAARPVFSEVTA